MLEYAKIILPKVSFSRELFTKELAKCIKWLEPDQVPELCTWCHERFNKLYPVILTEAFADIVA